MTPASSHDLGWYSDPDYGRDGQLLTDERDTSHDDDWELNPECDPLGMSEEGGQK